MTKTMRAVTFAKFGEPAVLTVTELPIAEPSAGMVRVRVRASFVAFGRDVSLRSGKHPVFPRLITLPHTLGGEHAGVVDAVGPGVDAGLVGSKVAVSAPVTCRTCDACADGRSWDCSSVKAIGIQLPGSNAEFTIVPAGNVERLPDGMSFEQAAALAASGPLAWEELDAGLVRPGEWVFVPGASGAVGTLIVALAKRQGAQVIAATRGRRAAELLTALGADAVVDTSDPELAGTLRELSPHGIEVVIDNVTDVDLWTRYWPAVARRGRIVTAGQASANHVPLPIDVVAFYNRRATLTGLTIGDPRPITAFWASMRQQPITLPDGLVTTFDMSDTAQAHAYIENGGKVGHTVVSIP